MRQRIGGLSKFRSFANRVAKSFGRSMVLACLLTRGALAGSLAPDEAELDRTWSAGRTTWSDKSGIVTGLTASSLGPAGTAVGAHKAPAVVYLHGCSGLDEISSATANFLAAAGYVVFSPDSFARTNKPVSCNVAAHESSLHRGVLALRQAEAAHAVAQVRRLPFIDGRRIYFYGFSEGAIAAATATGLSVRARIVEGWTCHAGWPEYVGLRAPSGQPTLTMTSQDDPWFRADWARGDCGAFMQGRPGSRSVVFRQPDPLSAQHYVSGGAEVQATILKFLREH
jgi:poly(3-hydroxybutyrate) depolymerase